MDTNRDVRADPHHVAGNLYFVGDPADTSFLLVGDTGNLLIDAAGQDDAHKIVDNIEQLGFDIKELKVLLAAGSNESLAAVQQASGAELWASDGSADVIASGGANDSRTVYLPYRLMRLAGVTTYPPARVDHRVKDGQTIRLGSLAVTAHVTPGTGFCTAWTFTVRDRDRDLHVVHRCGLELSYGASLVEPPRRDGIRAEFEQTLVMLRNLPVDIWLTPRPGVRPLPEISGESQRRGSELWGVQRLALFGSVLHGRARPDSDVDLLVQFRPGAKSYERFVRLCELLEAHLGQRVELVTTESLSPFIGPRILADAQDVLRAA